MLLPYISTQEGIDICVKDHEHLPNECLPIKAAEEEIDIYVSDEHSLKTFSPIEITEEGIDKQSF